MRFLCPRVAKQTGKPMCHRCAAARTVARWYIRHTPWNSLLIQRERPHLTDREQGLGKLGETGPGVPTAGFTAGFLEPTNLVVIGSYL